MFTLPEFISDSQDLDDLLTEPSEYLVDFMARLDGDLLVLGVTGKMGPTLAGRAVRAVQKAGCKKTIYGAARFSDPEKRKLLENQGVTTIACDLLDSRSLQNLPDVPNVIFMAGRKFGTEKLEYLTWAMNALLPWKVAERFHDARFAVFSTGCVYPLRKFDEGGCDETVPVDPVGEYSQSCLARERLFQYASRIYKTKISILRLNYAIDLRYGVLHDLAVQIFEGQPVCDTVGYFNVIWQGDACDAALRSLALADHPPFVLNVTGPETISTRHVAMKLGGYMNLPVRFTDTFRDLAYLNDAGLLHGLMGYPSVSLDHMIRWQAEWIRSGGLSLGKPTHFEVNDGKY
jgi:nucleoside-diphosphate-sugar epimerase